MADEIENAYQILGVKPGSSLEQVEEAYLKELALWNPKLYRGDPEKEAAAQKQQEEIRSAVNRIRSHFASREDSAGDLYQQIFTAQSARPRRRPRPARTSQAGPSLLSETFSSKSQPVERVARKTPPWLYMGGAILLVSALLYVLLPEQEEPAVLRSQQQEEVAQDSAPDEGLDSGAAAAAEAGEKEDSASSPAGEKASAPARSSQKSEAGKQNGAGAVSAGSEQDAGPAQASAALSTASGSAQSSPPRATEVKKDNARPVLVRQKKEPAVASRQTEQPSTRSSVTAASEKADPSRQSRTNGPDVPQQSSPEQPDPKAVEAFELLKQKSEAARRLSQGSLEGLQFQNWKVVQTRGTSFWIDLVAVAAETGTEQHLIWEVDTEGERISPLSQASRDLESRFAAPSG